MTLIRTRAWDWQERLAQVAAQYRTFEYGENDCALFAFRCVDAMCGTDMVAQIRERFNYRDEESAEALIVAGGGLPRMIEEFLGAPIRAAFAAPGDLVLARNGDGKPIITVMIGHYLVAPHADGPLHLPYSAGLLCWRV